MSVDENWGERSGLVGKMAAGRYLIVSELAADARHTLYEAENVELGTRVTLGVVRADGTASTERLRNGEKLRALKQRGLASVLDVGKLDSGELFVAAERAVGTSLRAVINGKPVDHKRALGIVRQVLEALAAAHDSGAIHGDVRPENLIVTSDGNVDRVTLIDFGVATLAGAKPGDPRYSAPESALGSIDSRADLYSAGALLFELLTGHPPFFADDPNALRRLHAYAPMQTLKQRAPDLEFVPALEDVVARALQKKRDQRYQSARDMIDALDAALQAVDEATPYVPPPEPEAGRRRKVNDSLLVLAKDLMPAQAPSAEIAIPVNTGRTVPELPLHMRAMKSVRRADDRVRDAASRVADRIGLRAALAKLTTKQKRIIAAAAAGLGLLLVVALVTCGGSDGKPAAKQTAGSAPAAAAAATDDGAEVAPDSEEEAAPAEDVVPDLLAQLARAKSCEGRREVIDKLADVGDRRALPALRKAKAQTCVEKAAAAAIKKISAPR